MHSAKELVALELEKCFEEARSREVAEEGKPVFGPNELTVF